MKVRDQVSYLKKQPRAGATARSEVSACITLPQGGRGTAHICRLSSLLSWLSAP